MSEGVRYAYLRPAEILRRRTAAPVAWLPLGVLEWHGPQNPTGLDALKAEGLLCEAARAHGGLVMPTLFWGDHRRALAEVVFDPAVSPWFPQHIPDQTGKIAALTGVPRERLEREAERLERQGAWRVWRELVTNMLFETESLGFDCLACYAGHAPLCGPLKEAAEAYRNEGGQALVVLLDIPGGEDHAARRETSLMMALCPGLADLGELSPTGERHIGMLGEDPLRASAEYGWELTRAFVAEAGRRVAEARDRGRK
jgi:creatinine amidohydrolase